VDFFIALLGFGDLTVVLGLLGPTPVRAFLAADPGAVAACGPGEIPRLLCEDEDGVEGGAAAAVAVRGPGETPRLL
jgi:hypothetical protein